MAKHRKATPVAQPEYVLRLYVADATPHSRHAVATIHRLCQERLSGRYDLEIIDIWLHPERAKRDQVVAIPTLVRERPLPMRRFVGSLADGEKVMQRLV